MAIVFILNTVIGCILFSLSAIISSVIYDFLFSIFNNLQIFFFLLVLLISIVSFFLLYVFFAILTCRIIVSLTGNEIGIFPNTSKKILLRVTADVLTCHLSRPLYPSMPFLISLMGAKTGKNFIFTGKIFNAYLLEAGDNVLVGEEAFICGHLQQKNKMILDRINIGDNVTIGVRSFIMPDVIIGDNSIIAAYSVVPMGTRIPPNEIWGGNPIKKISDRKD